MAVNPEFVPPNDDPPTAEEDFNDLETPEADPADDIVVTAPEPPPVGRSWAFDFIRGQFATAAGGMGPLGTSGDDTLAFWIEKTLRTARGAHPIYPSEYGTEEPFEFIGRTLTGAEYATIEGRIHEALTQHPRITDVTDFYITQDPDDEALFVSFRVVKDDDEAFHLSNLALLRGL